MGLFDCLLAWLGVFACVASCMLVGFVACLFASLLSCQCLRLCVCVCAGVRVSVDSSRQPRTVVAKRALHHCMSLPCLKHKLTSTVNWQALGLPMANCENLRGCSARLLAAPATIPRQGEDPGLVWQEIITVIAIAFRVLVFKRSLRDSQKEVYLWQQKCLNHGAI